MMYELGITSIIQTNSGEAIAFPFQSLVEVAGTGFALPSISQ